MNAETMALPPGIRDELADLGDAAGLIELAIDGLRELARGCEPGEPTLDALAFGARLVRDRVEHVAAALDRRPTRWRTELAPENAEAATDA